jgi:hypothetical protein
LISLAIAMVFMAPLMINAPTIARTK